MSSTNHRDYIQNELSLNFCASCSHYLNPVQTCNTFHIELIYLVVTGSSSVNGLCYELWKFRKNHPSLYNLAELLGCDVIFMNTIKILAVCTV